MLLLLGKCAQQSNLGLICVGVALFRPSFVMSVFHKQIYDGMQVITKPPTLTAMNNKKCQQFDVRIDTCIALGPITCCFSHHLIL